jgi:hypothetical protein
MKGLCGQISSSQSAWRTGVPTIAQKICSFLVVGQLQQIRHPLQNPKQSVATTPCPLWVARAMARLLIEHSSVIFSTWFLGKDNQVADSLSHDHHIPLTKLFAPSFTLISLNRCPHHSRSVHCSENDPHKS